jgi:pentatricopeptide repeat protein
VQQGIPPSVATYTTIIDALCKARAMDKAEVILQHMIDSGVLPYHMTYHSLIHGYF